MNPDSWVNPGLWAIIGGAIILAISYLMLVWVQQYYWPMMYEKKVRQHEASFLALQASWRLAMVGVILIILGFLYLMEIWPRWALWN